jgi:hypothetical protein
MPRRAAIFRAMKKSTRYFCTLFDRNYLYKGAVMLRSLVQQSPGSITHVLCLDEMTLG